MTCVFSDLCMGELPPHARRIRCAGLGPLDTEGTTSACAENTALHQLGGGHQRNYLRMRGEYGVLTAVTIDVLELPPHARRIPCHTAGFLSYMRTTSACAENTHRFGKLILVDGNYLRMRGEYHDGTLMPMIFMELPPHARRIHRKSLSVRMGIGTTSACAENTQLSEPANLKVRNYLRMRGEYPK